MINKKDDCIKGLESAIEALIQNNYSLISSCQYGIYSPQKIAEYLLEAHENHRTGGILLTYQQKEELEWLAKETAPDHALYWDYFAGIEDNDFIKTDKQGEPENILKLVNNDDGDYYLCSEEALYLISNLEDMIMRTNMRDPEIAVPKDAAIWNTIKTQGHYGYGITDDDNITTLPTATKDRVEYMSGLGSGTEITNIKECSIIMLCEIPDDKIRQELREELSDIYEEDEIDTTQLVVVEEGVSYLPLQNFMRLDNHNKDLFWDGYYNHNAFCSTIIKLSNTDGLCIIADINS